MNENKQTIDEEIQNTEVNEIEEADIKSEVRETAEATIRKVRDQALILGARMICSNCVQIINKHLNKEGKISLRTYERCFRELYDFITVPLKEAEKEATQDVLEETIND